MGSFPTPRNGILSIDYEFILIFKKLGSPSKVSKEVKDQSKMTTEEWKEYFSGHWNFGGVKQDGHIAMFPEELPKRLIKMFAFKGETVLDPFMGSGTTSLAAKNLERNSIGYEINPEFIEIAKQKLNINQTDISGTTYEFLKDSFNLDVEEAFENLPYRFTDFQSLDKKVDPKKLQFGSKIDKNSGQREEYFSIKEIISPELVRLNNDLIVRLIGIKEKEDTSGLAREFLYDKTKGQKVFMKFDSQKYDEQNNLMCYLYLKNKTFLNAHLIKEGLVEPNTDLEFKYREKFLNLSNGI